MDRGDNADAQGDEADDLGRFFLLLCGGAIVYRNTAFVGLPLVHLVLLGVLVLNGLFLSFRVSPYMLERERAGNAGELLPTAWQRKIVVSLIISDVGWWGSLVLFAWWIAQ